MPHTQQPASPPGVPPEARHADDTDTHRFPIVWKGSVNLKSQSVAVRLHELDGRSVSLAGHLPSTVTVTQRMRMEAEHINKFVEELRTHNGGHRTFIGHADDSSEDIHGEAPNDKQPSASGGCAPHAAGSLSREYFKTHLVKYLNERSVAGVVQLDCPNGMWDRLYLFPPGSFANLCIMQKVPDLDMSKQENYLFVVLLPKA